MTVLRMTRLPDGRVQVERGEIATPFERPNPATELALAKRYLPHDKDKTITPAPNERPWFIHDVPEPPPGPLADLQRSYGNGMLTWAAAIDAVSERLTVDERAAEEIVADWDDGGWSY